jgi:glucose/arabinose dehydrogenase
VSQVIATGLREPAGVAFRDGALYVSAVSRVVRFDEIEKRLANPPAPVVVTDRFPTDGHHGRKFIAFGPDWQAVRSRRRAVQHLRARPGAATATSCG